MSRRLRGRQGNLNPLTAPTAISCLISGRVALSKKRRLRMCRITPLFRHWWKCRMLSLAKGWRKGYRWFRSPAAYSKARTIAGIRYKQTEPGRQYRGLESHPARTVSRRSARNRQNRGSPAASAVFTWAGPEGIHGPRSPGNGGPQPPLGTDDSRPLRRRHSRGYRGTLTLPRGPRPWPTPPAGTATAAPTPALAVARAPRESWPVPSTRTSEAGARDFLQNNEHFGGDQGPRSAHIRSTAPVPVVRY